MKSLHEYIMEAQSTHRALGHFNISNLEALWGIFLAAKNLNVPVIIGVSEGERDFIGVSQVRALVNSLSRQFDYPIFLNADHTYSLDRIKEVVAADFDSVIIDGAKLSLEDNISLTKQTVDLVKSLKPQILVEAELGYIGSSSKLLDEIPDGATQISDAMPSGSLAKEFVTKTGIDLLSPAVGNIHGMLKNAANPKLNIDRIREIKSLSGVPLVLHGGSGISDEDFVSAINAGISVVHINTEIRVAYRDALQTALSSDPDEIAPYKYLKPAITAVENVVAQRLKLFNQSEEPTT